ncbi:MAG TPA: ATP-binding protein [Pirellulales bacterium]|nr:ATP-binding protein [Pirellulales bacterium]
MERLTAKKHVVLPRHHDGAAAALAWRAEELFREHQRAIYRRTDRLFAALMPLQWLGSVAAALWLSPLTWQGTTSEMHPHVIAALVLGGLITVFPVALALTSPGAALTRYAIATGQMLMSGLLIHVMGGRIETHFHVFGSLAFLAFYRDWRVFLPATLVVAGDHLLRGIFWPQSVFGLAAVSPWRWLEHAAWVLFEDVFLLISCRQSVREMRDIAWQRASLEGTNHRIEAEVATRTAELKAAQEENLQIARRAGMAEVAIGVLHNVGNVLNSVNASTSLIGAKLRNSATADFCQATDLLEQHLQEAGEFIARDPRGKHLPRFLIELSRHVASEETALLEEVESLTRSVEHIKEIVAVQQDYARCVNLVEEVAVDELIDDALRMNLAALDCSGIEVQRDFDALPRVHLDKHKFLQIVINLISNAKRAVIEAPARERRITVRLKRDRQSGIRVEVSDNGIGIPPENLTRIFAQGFTTRKEGHGFGLHSAANLASELGGRLTVDSDGLGAGATFTLQLPTHSTGSYHDRPIHSGAGA